MDDGQVAEGTRSALTGQSGGFVPTPTPFVLSEGHHETFRETDDSIVDFEPGAVIADQFEVVRPLGRGGMGVVYEVFDRLTRQRLALKTILPSILAKPQAAERFVHEVNIVRRLRHPGIVAVYDVRQIGGLLFFTMEYLEGLTLRQILLKYRRFPLGKAVGVIHRVSVTLEYAHQYAVHRDISPENIMILSDATVRLLDFGIAKALDLQGLSQKELPIGKSYYMSPEQRDNPATVDARTDIFSLGVVLFEMLTGELPSGYNRLTQVRPDVPEMLEKVIGWALATRDQRYPTARQFRKAVEGCYKIYKRDKGIAKPQTPQEKPVQKNGAPPGNPEKGMPETLRATQEDWEEWERHLQQRRAERIAAPPVPPPAKPGWLAIADTLRKWTKKE